MIILTPLTSSTSVTFALNLTLSPATGSFGSIVISTFVLARTTFVTNTLRIIAVKTIFLIFVSNKPPSLSKIFFVYFYSVSQLLL